MRNTWDKALSRSQSDPEGAITSARTLIESTCKYILDFRGIEYQNDSELPKLYNNTAQSLNLAPSQQTETIFRQILGNCQSIVESIGALRNRLGDAHGRGQEVIRVDERHAILAVELAGAMAMKFPRNSGRSKKSVNYSEEEQHEQAAVEFKI